MNKKKPKKVSQARITAAGHPDDKSEVTFPARINSKLGDMLEIDIDDDDISLIVHTRCGELSLRIGLKKTGVD